MWQKNSDSSLMAVICYCVLAFGVTGIVAQDGVKAAGDSTSPPASSKSESPGSPALPENETATTNASNAPTGTSSKTTANPTTNVGPSTTSFDAPAWFPADAESDITSNNGTDTISISEAGYGIELQNESEDLILERVADYVGLKLGDGASQYVRFSVDELRKMNVVTHEATVTGTDSVTGKQSPAEMYYATLSFDQGFRKKAEQTWIEQRQSSRLMQIGLVSAGLLLVIGFLFGTLKLSSATSGFYQGRLQFLGGIVILGIICAATYFGLQLDWI